MSSYSLLSGLWYGLVAAGLVVGLGGCGGESADPSATNGQGAAPSADTATVTNVLQTDDRFSTLVAALDSTGLDSVLASEGSYTLFAPTNEAFSSLPEGTTEALLREEHDRLRTILTHHVVEERIHTASVSDSQQVTMMSGGSLPLRTTPNGIHIGEGRVLDGNIEVSNGLIHVIDRVLPPPSDPSES